MRKNSKWILMGLIKNLFDVNQRKKLISNFIKNALNKILKYRIKITGSTKLRKN
jgi:hypothetical protein